MSLRLLAVLIPVLLATNPSLLAESGDAETVDLSRASQMIVQQTNRFRNDHDLDPLEVDEALQKAAQKFADFMSENDKYGHYADNRSPAERAKAAGYEYCSVRENIAYRTDSQDLDAEFLADHFTQGWIDSPGHRENMLADFVTQTGVAVSTTDGLTYFAVQLFGRPKSQAYRVELTNRSESVWTIQIESNGGSEEIEVPPRGSLRMKRCFPITLNIAETDAQIRLKDSANLQIESKGDKPKFVRQ